MWRAWMVMVLWSAGCASGPGPTPASAPEEVQMEDGVVRIMAVEAADPFAPFEQFEVFRDGMLLGRVAVTSRYQYGVKPQVVVRDASGAVVFEGLWEQPFETYEAIVPAAVEAYLSVSEGSP